MTRDMFAIAKFLLISREPPKFPFGAFAWPDFHQVGSKTGCTRTWAVFTIMCQTAAEISTSKKYNM